METQAPWTALEFEARLRRLETGYHIHHAFNRRLNGGELQPFQVRGWVANRYYYQLCLPLKDAAILSNCEDRAARRRWAQRIMDHDGRGDEPGGLEAWAALGAAVGLSRADLESQRHVQPGVRFAVDAYVSFARRAPWQEAAISS
ncbi:MAG TPA: pyrroloquinoline quinone biosynthesis protein C, partial [Burkholderiaceae bacterium]